MRSRLAKLSKPPANIPARPSDGHKGLFGRVLIFGGNRDMVGAPVLAGLAALRMGSGLVQAGMPWSTLAAGLTVVPELVGLGLGESKADDRKLFEAADRADVVVIGPGLGASKSAGRRIDALIRLEKPKVIDADGLNYLASLKNWPTDFAGHSVLTPHPGEMKRLIKADVPSDEAGRIETALRAVKRFGQIVVLKGHRTIVCDGKRVFINRTGDSSLSKAGTGDVLSGMLASLIGQGMAEFDAACLAVHLHGLCGASAGKQLGKRCVLARDVIAAIPGVLARDV